MSYLCVQGKVKDIELKGHSDSVDQLCWDPKHADLIATASGDKTVRLWDARSKLWCLNLKIMRINTFNYALILKAWHFYFSF